ncbi:nucleoside-diphosphate sugar epimerase [Paenibacillus sp. HJL G12]|uniref:Nucleoside-diphosphate sugar epimerase n=1 Tax=Paenibacillus dendrobii TaxID=2691084 RepID=A0A7X3LKR1_9BACL|nr:nucleoside-diphosphate sugar epimerase [Paenibacillus dendrobii]MWV46853.1 nucleoside-diphosphate sugar epimerase [Paenibacillus dendrobii]
MQSKIDEMLTHMSHSHQQMARVLDAERQMAVRMAQIIHDLPDSDPEFDGINGLIENSGQINKSIIAYLGSIADLQEALAETLNHVVKELGSHEEE